MLANRLDTEKYFHIGAGDEYVKDYPTQKVSDGLIHGQIL